MNSANKQKLEEEKKQKEYQKYLKKKIKEEEKKQKRIQKLKEKEEKINIKKSKKDFKEWKKKNIEILQTKKKIIGMIFKAYVNILKKDISLRYLTYFFDVFKIKYKYETLLYWNSTYNIEDEMKIGYFEIESLIDGTLKQRQKYFKDFTYNILVNLLIFQFPKYKKQPEIILETELIPGYTIKDVTEQVSNLFSYKLLEIFLTYYNYIKEIFDDTFEKKAYYYSLKDKDFLFNEEKQKLLKEYKISSIENALKNKIKKYLAITMKEEFFGEKNNEKVDITDLENIEKDIDTTQLNNIAEKEEIENVDIDIDETENQDNMNEDEIRKNKIDKRKKLEERERKFNELEKKNGIKNKLILYIERKIEYYRNLNYDDVKNKQN